MSMRSPKAMPLQLQQPYNRNWEDPYFKGLLRHGDQLPANAELGSKNVSRSSSDVGTYGRGKKLISYMSEKSDLPSDQEDSISDDHVFGKLTNIPKAASFLTDLRYASGANSANQPNPDTFDSEPTEAYSNVVIPATSTIVARPANEKTYAISRRNQEVYSKIPIPQSAASFYDGFSRRQVEIVEFSESILRVNLYLKSRRDDVNAGVPGKFLHAVIAQDVYDAGSIASTIMYAYYLNETLESDQLCTVPVINMKRADLNSHAELKWLLESCQIEESSLVFVDEVDLSYYNLFGSLKLVLLNGHKLLTRQEALKESVVEIFNCKQGESLYPGVEMFTVGEDSSSCTLIAEKFALNFPEILAGRGFSRLLITILTLGQQPTWTAVGHLAGILLDTGDLTSPRCTVKDRYLATLLINGAGRFGSSGLFQILRYKMQDVSDLKIVDILRKDFKKWTRVGKTYCSYTRLMVSNVGMSFIGISIEQLLAHAGSSAEEIKYFQQLEKLKLLVTVSGYYDSCKNFKREMLVSAESVELMRNLLLFFNSNASELPLKVLRQPGGLRDDMKAFEIDNVTSRRTIERLLEEFGGASRG